jgi:hypothetical protein
MVGRPAQHEGLVIDIARIGVPESMGSHAIVGAREKRPEHERR